MQFHKLLCVDWDSFFADKLGSNDPDWGLYDWGHAESDFFIHALWSNRAMGFVMNGLPLPETTGEERTFWPRFRFDADAKLYFAESNASAVHPDLLGEEDVYSQVWLYDAHHDSGYRRKGQTVRSLTQAGQWSCEDWMVLYKYLGASCHVRYPTWKTWAFDVEPKPLVPVDRKFDDGGEPRNGRSPISFDRIFVCRSGAWVPSWLDDRFEQFLRDCPVQDQTGLHGPLPPREFSMDQVRREMEQYRQAMNR